MSRALSPASFGLTMGVIAGNGAFCDILKGILIEQINEVQLTVLCHSRGLSAVVLFDNQLRLLVTDLSHCRTAVLGRFWHNLLNIVKETNQRTSYSPCEIDRHSIANLLVLVTHASFKLPIIRESLDTCIFPYTQWAGLQWMAPFGLLLTWRAGESQ